MLSEVRPSMLAFCLLSAVSLSMAQFHYPGPGAGCSAPLQASDFVYEEVFRQNVKGDGLIEEPVKMDFDMHAIGNIDIYFVERYGKLRMFSGSTGSVKTLYAFPDVTAGTNGNNDGLVGIKLDPGFKRNGWIYLLYSRMTPSVWRLSRFKITSGVFDRSSELIMLDVPTQRGFWHTGGDMSFDDYGDLWVALGDNTSYYSAANTNNLVGKILRIRPVPVPDGESRNPGPGGTYTIPEGNLFPESEDTAQETRPEIFIAGTRNPYTISVDPVRRWIAWGDVGPDNFGMKREEYNLYTRTANAGWPFFSGDNLPSETQGGRYEAILVRQDPAAPVNQFWEASSPKNPQPAKGRKKLPPAVGATYSYDKACAMTGPVYRYDAELPSNVKLPPHFDRVWFTSDCGLAGGGVSPFYAFKLNADGTPDTKTSGSMDNEGVPKNAKINMLQSLFKSLRLNKPLDIEQGPDGALYFLNYAGSYSSSPNTGVARLVYKGSCRPGYPEHARIEKAGCMDPKSPLYDSKATHPNPTACGTTGTTAREMEGRLDLQVKGGVFSNRLMGAVKVDIRTLDGRAVGNFEVEGGGAYAWSEGLEKGAYILIATVNGFSKYLRGMKI